MTAVVFDKYHVIRRLAIGGMGEIFLARQMGLEALDRLVILKTLLPDLAEQQSFVKLFLDEARVAATLNHPNIVSIYEVGNWQGNYFIAMEYIHGENLARLLKVMDEGGQRIPYAVSARIIRDAARALDHAHHARSTDGTALNIVHRDVSPQNIMVRRDGVTKVVDFGIARAANRTTRTRTGVIKGKFRYMSPEQVAAERELDGRSDLFSLGIVLWELCTNKGLFVAENEIITMRKLTSEEIPSPRSLFADTPAELDEIVMHMLERDRQARYQRCADVADDLTTFLDGQTESATQANVAELIQANFGEALDERTRDLTPSQKLLLGSVTPRGVGAQRGPGATAAFADTIADPENEVAAAARRRPTVGSVMRWAIVAVAATLVFAAIAWWWVVREPAAGTTTAGRVRSVPIHEVQLPHRIEQVAPGKPPSPPPPLPVLVLTTEPPGATVSVGTETLGKTPLELGELAADVEHIITVRLTGHESQRFQLKLAPGERREMNVPLFKSSSGRRSTPPSSGSKQQVVRVVQQVVQEPGFLSLTTKPWTKVSINGRPWGSTPLYKVELSPGKHELHLKNEQAGIDHRQSVVIKPGRINKVRLDLKKSRGNKNTP